MLLSSDLYCDFCINSFCVVLQVEKVEKLARNSKGADRVAVLKRWWAPRMMDPHLILRYCSALALPLRRQAARPEG